jgi:hypothetical protein
MSIIQEANHPEGNSVLTEIAAALSPALHITNPSSEGLLSQPTPIVQPHEDLDVEDREVEARIVTLWGDHSTEVSRSVAATARLKAIKSELAKELYRLKQNYVKPGKEGQWGKFLKERGIPRSTADRYALKHARSIKTEEGNLLTEEITPSTPTDKKIIAKVNALAPGLSKFLGTRGAVSTFVNLLNVALLDCFASDSEPDVSVI